MADGIKKVVLAYSGGLDTSVILKWLQVTYGCEVVTFTADLGQGEELGPARKKAEMFGVKEIYHRGSARGIRPRFRLPDVPRQRALRGHLSARHLDRPAADRQAPDRDREAETGADAVCHGATGKGNDQVRFELGYYALNPDIKVIAPWREWDLTSRTKLIDFAEKHQIPIAKDKRGEAPFSVDANLSAYLGRGQGSGGPVGGSAGICLQPHRRARGRARQADLYRGRVREGRRGGDRRQADVAGGIADGPEQARPRQRHRPGGPGRESLRRHEVARHLRDAGRHDPLCGPSRHREHHARSRRGASEGRPDAALCRADL